jgi:hypothetical protein
MGTFNGERYVTEQLSTVMQQSLPPEEIIVCDDGSTDATLTMVDRMRRSSAIPFRIVRNEQRLGFADNFLNGASLACSRYVAFCDQDDRWYPNKLETALESMIENEALLSAHAVDLIDSRGLFASRYSQGIEKTEVIEALSGDPWEVKLGFTLVFRRDLLDVIPATERGENTYASGAPLSHDRWVCALAHSLGRIVLIDASLACYRQHGAQLWGVRGPKRTSAGSVALRVLNTREKFAALAREQATLARVCCHRAALFASAKPTHGYSRERLDRASAFWTSLGDLHAARVAVHQASPLSARIRALSASLRQGNYSSEQFGYGSFLKDLGLCLLGPLVHREAPEQQPCR